MPPRYGQPREIVPEHREQETELLSVTDNRIQVLLALRVMNEQLPGLSDGVLQYEEAGPDLKKEAMEKWLEGERNGGSLSARYRAFIEDPANTGMRVDTTDPKALDALLASIRAYPVTMH